MSSLPGRKPNFEWVLDDKVSQLIRRKARQLSWSPGFNRSDESDIEQELKLLLLQKAARFNEARSKATTFANRLIENKAASMIRRVDAGMRSYRRNSISLNEEVSDEDGGVAQVADLFDESAGRRLTGQGSRSATELTHLRLDLAEANRHLPAALKRMAALLSHVPEYPAGQVLGLSRRQTARCVNELRELYAARGLAE